MKQATTRRTVLGVVGVVVGGVQRLGRGGGRVFQSILHSLPPLRLELQRLLQLPLGLLFLLQTLLDGGCRRKMEERGKCGYAKENFALPLRDAAVQSLETVLAADGCGLLLG